MPLSRSARTERALAILEEAIPSPETELIFDDAYQLMVAVVLSAQCTDARVNETTPAFFARFPTVGALSAAEPEDVLPLIKSISYPNNKSKHLVAAARKIMADFGGEVPSQIDDLVTLQGVGRKSAQVIASVAYRIPALPVDTHVFRVANRIGMTKDASTPLKVEQQLKRVIPRERWGLAHHLLILHGRYTCTARSPKCETCPVAPVCQYYERLQQLPPPITGLDAGRARFFCRAGGHYFDQPVLRPDHYGTEQIACPVCDSTNVFETRTGKTTRRVRDYRVG